MDAHDGAYVTGQVSAACGDGKVLGWVQTVGVDHKVAVVLVDVGGFASVAIVEELRQSLALNGVNGVHVEPGAVTG